MCNYYVMYWMSGDETLERPYCASPGPPRWSWLNDPSLDVDDVPSDASLVPGFHRLMRGRGARCYLNSMGIAAWSANEEPAFICEDRGIFVTRTYLSFLISYTYFREYNGTEGHTRSCNVGFPATRTSRSFRQRICNWTFRWLP